MDRERPGAPVKRRRAGGQQQVGPADPFLAVPEVADIGQILDGLGRVAERRAAAALRLAPGGILCWLYRDIDFGGPQLAVPSEEGRLQPDGSVLVELDDWWRYNLTAVKPGTLRFRRAELIPRVDHLPVTTVRLPMAMTPPGYNDLIGALRLVR